MGTAAPSTGLSPKLEAALSAQAAQAWVDRLAKVEDSAEGQEMWDRLSAENKELARAFFFSGFLTHSMYQLRDLTGWKIE